MAVKVTVYGTANMRQIELARKELDKLEGQARKSATGFKGAMGRFSSAASSTGARIASGLAAAGIARWLKGSMEVAAKAQESIHSFENAVMATNGTVDNSRAASEAAAKAALDLKKAQTGAALAHNLAAQAAYKHGKSSLEYQNAVNSAALADAKAAKYAQASKDAQYALTHAVKTTSINWDEYSAKAQKVLVAQSDLSAYSKGQLRDAMTQLVTTTGDANKSLSLLQVTTDLARRKHIDLEQAAVLVGRAYNGNIVMLKRMGIELPKGAKGMEAIDALQKRVAGSAKTYGDSAAGAQDKFNNNLKALQVTVGTTLLPALTSFMKSLSDLIRKFQSLSPGVQGFIIKAGAATAAVLILTPWITRLSGAIKAIYSVSKTAVLGLVNLIRGMRGTAVAAEGQALPAMAKLGGVIRRAALAVREYIVHQVRQLQYTLMGMRLWIRDTALKAANAVKTVALAVATKAAAAGQWLLNVALNANPIGIVVVAVAALVAVLVILIKRNETVRRALLGAWNAIVGFFTGLPGKFMALGRNIVQGLLNGLSSLKQQVWDAITKPISGAVDWVKSHLGIQSPSKVTHEIGVNIGQGFANGIAAKKKAVQGAVKGLADTVTKTLSDALVNVDRQSAVSALSEAGLLRTGSRMGFDVKALTDAALGSGAGMAQVRTAFAKFRMAHPEQWSQDADGKLVVNRQALDKVDKFWAKFMKVQKDLKKLGSENDLVAKAIGKANDSLADALGGGGGGGGGTKLQTRAERMATSIKAAKTAMVAALKDYVAQVKAVKDRVADLMSSWSVLDMATPERVSSDYLLAAVKSQADTMKTFIGNIANLKKTALAPAIISSLLAAGPAQAAGSASAFASMTPAQIAQYNADYSAMGKSARDLATLQLGKPAQPKAITIAPGAVKVEVHVAGNASEKDIRAAVDKAFAKFTKELRSK